MAGAVVALLLLLLLSGQSCPAQSRKRLPDSIPGSVENTPPPVVDTAAVPADSFRTSASSDTESSGSLDTGHSENTTAQHDSVVFRTVPDSVIERLKKDKDFAYANDPAYWTPENENRKQNHSFDFLEKFLNSQGFKYFVYLLLAAILFYALYKIIAENNLQFFYKAGAKAANLAGETISMQEEDLEEGLKQAMGIPDHRLAVRYLYLKALRHLDAKELIRYHAQATNQEYISQLGGLPQQEPFRLLTRAYERVWYGDFAISGQQFTLLQTYFKDFDRSLG